MTCSLMQKLYMKCLFRSIAVFLLCRVREVTASQLTGFYHCLAMLNLPSSLQSRLFLFWLNWLPCFMRVCVLCVYPHVQMTEQRKNKQRLGFLGPSQINHQIPPAHWGWTYHTSPNTLTHRCWCSHHERHYTHGDITLFIMTWQLSS